MFVLVVVFDSPCFFRSSFVAFLDDEFFFLFVLLMQTKFMFCLFLASRNFNLNIIRNKTKFIRKLKYIKEKKVFEGK